MSLSLPVNPEPVSKLIMVNYAPRKWDYFELIWTPHLPIELYYVFLQKAPEMTHPRIHARHLQTDNTQDNEKFTTNNPLLLDIINHYNYIYRCALTPVSILSY